jgi:hypothetical protein
MKTGRVVRVLIRRLWAMRLLYDGLVSIMELVWYNELKHILGFVLA